MAYWLATGAALSQLYLEFKKVKSEQAFINNAWMPHLSGSCLCSHTCVCDLPECIWSAGRKTAHSFWTWVCANSSVSSVSTLGFKSLSLCVIITSLLYYEFNHMTVKEINSIHLMKSSRMCKSNCVVQEGFWSFGKYKKKKPWLKWKTFVPAENHLARIWNGTH